MKRSREDSNPSSSSVKAAKRSKSVQACTSCRKHKTRCEVLDTTSTAIRCHRCKTLDIPCSYEEMDRSILIQNASKTQSQAGTMTPAAQQERGQDVFDKWALGIEPNPPPPPIIDSKLQASPPPVLPPAPTLRRHLAKPHDIWTFLRVQYDELDWTAPLEAIQFITKHPANESAFTPSSVSSIPNDRIENILTNAQINDLLLIFSKHYEPWLNFTLMKGTDSPLLDLVCCTIAARHLDDNTRVTVAHRLHTLTQDNSAKLIFQSRRSESLEAIQCLLILSLWTPLSSASGDFGDGRLLIASAISMAMNLRLNEAPSKTLALLNSQRAGETVNESHLLEMMNKSRLWISLSNAESLLCIGSGREALSKRDSDYIQLFGLCENLPTDKIGGRDTRLRFLADIYEYTEKGFAIKFVSDAEQDVIDWYRANETIRKEFSQIHRLVLPLGVVAQAEKFHFQIILVILHSCRLLSLYNTMVAARMYFYRHPHLKDSANWFSAVRPYNDNVLLVYAKECLALAECTLVHFLQTDVLLVGTCPDHVFLMVSFAASFLVGVKFMLVEGIHRLLPGSSNTLLSMCIGHLRRAAYSPDHPANQSANVLSIFVSLWENKDTVIKQYRELVNPNTPSSSSKQSLGTDDHSGSFTTQSQSMPHLHSSSGSVSGDQAAFQNQVDFSWLNDPSFWNGILDTPM
ncbi:hypothetical protein E1B28_004765 [Marasmius oreades]|uniref:Zn(2)-C6 fungal-type domain-containing protein n=1 Tax=Marasmius oreades TaxID=181124 RepID=A0A9P7UZC2_9AGAR|nr:uncharacterized protein E1B28_004765 [Marasmius oreades]KAG7097418.1 hypothetical protein E1B28_004765 [Marasmius oreades]